MQEEWRPLEDFPSYAVNNLGEVLNLKTLTFVKPSTTINGTAKIGLVKDRKQYTVSLPKLVLSTFIPKNRPQFDTVITLNGDRLDCRLANLEWRPLWFARAYHGQFYDTNFYKLVRPFKRVDTGDVFETYRDACVKYGVLAKDVANSIRCYPDRQVFPHGCVFTLS